MWAYKFLKKSTRLQVPTYSNFLKQNHDLLKCWCEEEHEPLDERIMFPLRVIRFICYMMLILIFIHVLVDPKDKYYYE